MTYLYLCALLGIAYILLATKQCVHACFSAENASVQKIASSFAQQLHGILFRVGHAHMSSQTPVNITLLSLAIFQWFLIPPTSTIRAASIIFIHQVRLLAELVKYCMIQCPMVITSIKRKLILHLMGQYIITIALLAMVYAGEQVHFILGSLISLAIAVGSICQSNIGPFRSSLHIQEDSSIAFKLSHILNLMFAITMGPLTMSTHDNVLELPLASFTWLAVKMYIIMLLMFVAFSYVPSLRTDQCKRIFTRLFLPLSGAITVVAILTKMYSEYTGSP
ncbi:MAG: hypothetical protein LBR89_02650 [Holosporales bacterium]|nr:hypothetical protein [Holosporales bacterium]